MGDGEKGRWREGEKVRQGDGAMGQAKNLRNEEMQGVFLKNLAV